MRQRQSEGGEQDNGHEQRKRQFWRSWEGEASREGRLIIDQLKNVIGMVVKREETEVWTRCLMEE